MRAQDEQEASSGRAGAGVEQVTHEWFLLPSRIKYEGGSGLGSRWCTRNLNVSGKGLACYSWSLTCWPSGLDVPCWGAVCRMLVAPLAFTC